MDRNQAKEFYPILQAYAEGRVIECRTKPSAIESADVPNEWQEMKKHQPFGWVVNKRDGTMILIRCLEMVSVYTSIQYSFKDAFDKLVFADLVPFGVKDE